MNQGFPLDVFNNVLAYMLDGRDAAWLAATCRLWRERVENNRYLQMRRRTHYVRCDTWEEFAWCMRNQEAWTCSDGRVHVDDFPDFGEGRQMACNRVTGTLSVVNNFYEDSHFLDFPADNEGEILYEFPRAPGVQRWRVNGLTFHRGACIQTFAQRKWKRTKRKSRCLALEEN